MLTVKTLESIKLGSRITLYNGIFAVILGIAYMLCVKFILFTNFVAIDSVWQVFSKYNPEISSLYVELAILKGIFIVAIGVSIIYLSSFILKRKDRAAWVVLFIIGLIFWPSLLTFEIFDKNIYAIVLSFIGWLSFIIGMLIPISYYTQKVYEY